METKIISRSIKTFILLPSGFLIYLLINKLTFGSFFYFQKPLYTNWYKKFTFPWVSIKNLIFSIPNINEPKFYIYFSEVLAIVFISAFTIFIFLKIRRSYGVYMLVNLLLVTSTGFILSTPRYAVILFPIYIVLAKINNKLTLTIISLIFLSFLFYLTYIYTQGKWAY